MGVPKKRFVTDTSALVEMLALGEDDAETLALAELDGDVEIEFEVRAELESGALLLGEKVTDGEVDTDADDDGEGVDDEDFVLDCDAVTELLVLALAELEDDPLGLFVPVTDGDHVRVEAADRELDGLPEMERDMRALIELDAVVDPVFDERREADADGVVLLVAFIERDARVELVGDGVTVFVVEDVLDKVLREEAEFVVLGDVVGVDDKDT